MAPPTNDIHMPFATHPPTILVYTAHHIDVHGHIVKIILCHKAFMSKKCVKDAWILLLYIIYMCSTLLANTL